MRWYDGTESVSFLLATLVSAPFNFGEVVFGQFDMMDDGCGNGESFPAARLKLVSPNRLADTAYYCFFFLVIHILKSHVRCLCMFYLLGLGSCNS